MWVGLRDGAFLGHEEGVYRRGLVSINVGWLARGGLLHLEIPRLAVRAESARAAARRADEVLRLRRHHPNRAVPADPRRVLPGGVAPRIRLHFATRDPVDILPAGETLDDWLVAMREQHATWERRARFESTAG